MFGIGTGELLALAVVALLVLGPEKLPKFAADAARMIRQLRQMANNAKEDVRRELGPELQDISLDDLNPRSLMRKHFFDDDLGSDLDGDADGDAPPQRGRSRGDDAALGDAAAPYDPDAT